MVKSGVERRKSVKLWNMKKTADILKAHINTENIRHRYELAGHFAVECPLNWPKDWRKDDYFINEEALRELVLTSSQQPQAALLAEKYRIALYFPAYKLAIECDEFGHNNRDVSYEVNCQKFIEDQL